jgi:hypothetical protein
MIYRCCTDNRRTSIRGRGDVNGIDYLEVLDREAPTGSPRQRTLFVRFVNAAPLFQPRQFEITGGERINTVEVLWTMRADSPDLTLVSAEEAALFESLADPEEVLVLRTDSSGDYSTYTLRLRDSPVSLAPPPKIDPLLSSVRFSFKVECPSDFDCAPEKRCPPDDTAAPSISYLSKDYGSFRRLMFDRMAETLPEWSERNAADLGVALVETLAYVGDQLSYAQDAVSTEAYIGTARRRSSVRRHARLVGYRMHDGANARTWVQVLIDPKAGALDLTFDKLQFLTKVDPFPKVITRSPSEREYQLIMQREPLVFEPMVPLGADKAKAKKRLFPELETIEFYDWGDDQCCLPRGSVRATLRGNLRNLAEGDVLVFEERLGPRTGDPADADPKKRCAVRLVQVAPGLKDTVPQPAVRITEIRWADEDALPFSFCISSQIESSQKKISGVSGALGNILLADHGRTVEAPRDRELGTVPEPHLWEVGGRCCSQCDLPEARAIPPRYRPAVPLSPISQSAPLGIDRPGEPLLSAASLLRLGPRNAVPAIAVTGSDGSRWEARADLLASAGDDRHFVVELESDGTARLRFGNNINGLRPASGTTFTGDYRVGNGAAGNIGADALGHVVTGVADVVGARNPLPASGGTDPETMAVARIAAPQAFRRQERAVTASDYSDVARRHPAVQDAAATFRWNGHGHTVFVTVDRFQGLPVDEPFKRQLAAFIEPYRMAGYDLEIDSPRFVAIDLALFVCVLPNHFRSEVRRAVLEELSDQRLAGGRYGFFHPDNLSFNQPVYLSAIVACAQSVEGVDSVTALTFGRLGIPDATPLQTGILTIGRLEIARLSNNPDFPERGRLQVMTGGGK